MAVMLVRMPSKASPHPKFFHPPHFTVLVPCIGLVIRDLLCSQPVHCSHPHCHLHSLLHPNSPLSYLAACCIPILLQHLINALIKLTDSKGTSSLYHSFPLSTRFSCYHYLLLLSSPPSIPFLQLFNHLLDQVLSASNFSTASTFLLFFFITQSSSSLLSSIPSAYCITQYLQVTLAVPPLQPRPSCHL